MTVNDEAMWSDALEGADVEFASNHVVVRGNTQCTSLDRLDDDTGFELFRQHGAILFRDLRINYLTGSKRINVGSYWHFLCA